jgi:hypothetical protein
MSSSTPRGRPRKLPVDEQHALVLNAAAHMFAVHGAQAGLSNRSRARRG